MIVVDEKENLKKLYKFLDKELDNFNKFHKENSGVDFEYVNDARREILRKMNQTELWIHAFNEFEKYTNNSNDDYDYTYNLGEYFHLSLSCTHGLAFNIRHDNGKLGEAYKVFGSYSTIFEVVNNKIRDFLDLYYNWGWGFEQLKVRIDNSDIDYDIYDRDNNEKIVEKYRGIISGEIEKIFRFLDSDIFKDELLPLMEKSYEILVNEQNKINNSEWEW